jgi:hypothetical protein
MPSNFKKNQRRILYNGSSAFCCAWLWNETSTYQQLFTFISHKTSQCIETFVNTMLHCKNSIDSQT